MIFCHLLFNRYLVYIDLFYPLWSLFDQVHPPWSDHRAYASDLDPNRIYILLHNFFFIFL